MRYILIATHSTFASGINESLKLLIGERPEISVIDAYVDESDFTHKVDEFFSEFNSDDEYVVFTDLFGGSVNQKIFSYKNKYEFHLITGFNLPVLLEIILYGKQLSVPIVEDIIGKCRQELSLVNIENDDTEEENFL
ncbi:MULTISPECIES: PTS sugar transporter subunit IIA [Enterococcus]|uniref:PTS sugar transporter subunit IIA n=1 Tax=Enterococcus TaxID=1350 RepID=UPI000E50508D|nr:MULTISPECIES: PTS sugar transporter subunit IIA [Enterococcus]MBX9039393.1 PTS sugar transporter subunit IIA [Enterococcus raffinosus]RGY33294.1 PTS fructose transporter subunit IIA [Enterococcus avium]